jgi:DNA-binding transcriptional LysR family regulator
LVSDSTRSRRVDLNALLLFHEIAATGSLTRAAARLDVPKATLSRQLRALERDMDTLLVKRARGRLELTDAGAALYARMQTLAAEADGVVEYARNLRTEIEGVLRVAVPTGFMGALCGQAVVKFTVLHPRVRIRVQQTDLAVDVMRDPIDLVVHVGSSPSRHAPTHVLARIRRAAYASNEYLRAHAAPAHRRELAAHDCIALTSQQLGGVWSFDTGDGRTSRSEPRAVVSDIHLARELALAGVGIAVLPEALCRDDVVAGRLQRVLPEWRIPLAEVSASYADRRHLPQMTRGFLDQLRAQFAGFVSEQSKRPSPADGPVS